MFWRSKDILQRPEWSLVRALYKSMGYSDYDLARPMIGIANSWNRVVPGHYNLNLVSDYVNQGIQQAGGTPVEFGVIAACDGIAQGHDGMHYILPTRDLIAHDVEMMIEAHRLDGVVLLGSCDKILPGMLMAAARLDVPAILVAGGPMLALKIRPDLILLDIGLPGGDGYLTMTRLQSHLHLAQVPIIIMTAADASIHRDRVLEAGADAFLQKPIDNQQLLAAIYGALGETKTRTPIFSLSSDPLQATR